MVYLGGDEQYVKNKPELEQVQLLKPCNEAPENNLFQSTCIFRYALGTWVHVIGVMVLQEMKIVQHVQICVTVNWYRMNTFTSVNEQVQSTTGIGFAYNSILCCLHD